MKNNHGISNVLVILGATVLLVIAGYFAYKFYTKPQNNVVKISNNTETKTVTPDVVTPKPLPTDKELIDSIRNDLGLSMQEEISIDHKDRDKPSIANRYYLVTDKYEVVSAGYQFSMHVVYRPIDGGKWKSDKGFQNSYECADLDKLGFTRAQTIEWSCFEYDKQIYRK